VRAEELERGLLPPPEVKKFSDKARRRIERKGPREADLRDESGRIVKECLPRACLSRRRLLAGVSFTSACLAASQGE